MSDSERVNILVVDDLPDKILVLESILVELGQNIVVAHTGEEALRRVLDQDFAVILLDVNMPGMDGFETASYIRKRRRSALTPIIFMTAYVDEMHTLQGYSLGAVDYIFSPVVPEILRTKVKVFVDLFRMTQQVRKQADERVALAQEQAARAAAEEATRRFSFLAEASRVLASTLEQEATVRSFLRLMVPYLGDLASITLVGGPGQPWRRELAWIVPPGNDLQTLSLTSPDGPDDELRAALARVLATGKSEILEGLAVAYPPVGPDMGRPTLLAGLLHSAVLLPLLARGRTLGAFVLALSDSGRRFTHADLGFAEDLAGRAATSIDNVRLYEDIQEGDRRKNEFLAMLAHELRNPLAPIRNSVQIMRLMGLKEPQLVQARDMIDRQVTHMARLIDDLLDMSRLSRGKILLRKERLDIVQVVCDAVEDYRTMLESGGLSVDVRLPERPLYTMGDPVRVAQVVGNVLHNAGKFTDPGGTVAVAVTTEPGHDDAAGIARISIRDTGIGMDPEILSRLFDAFTQADRSLDRSRGGLGLGLALVKGLVELHGGSVEAASEGLGHGTEVSIRLPLKDQGAAPRRPKLSLPIDEESLRILVIEDNPDTAESMRMLLSLSGHPVTVAHTGTEGIEAARRFHPAVVLCDIGLPGGMDGCAVARSLRQEPELAASYLIALTGYGQGEDRTRCLEAGFDRHFTKPIDFAELQQVLATLPRGLPANHTQASRPDSVPLL